MALWNKHASNDFCNKNADFKQDNAQKATGMKTEVNRNESPALTFSSFSTDCTKDSISPDGEAWNCPLFFNEDFTCTSIPPKIKRTVWFKDQKVKKSIQTQQDTVEIIKEFRKTEIEEIRKNEIEVPLYFESTISSTSIKPKLPQRVQEFRTPIPKSSQRFFNTKKLRIFQKHHRSSEVNYLKLINNATD